MAADYTFRTVFAVDAPPGEVFHAVLTPDEWLPRMPYVRSLERLAGGAVDGTGTRYRTTVAAASPYQLRWVMEAERVVVPERIEWCAEGDLAGNGTWELRPAGTGTQVVSTASLRTTRWWMRLLAPLARPLFVRNHDVVMRAGVEALAAHLDATLVGYGVDDMLTSGR